MKKAAIYLSALIGSGLLLAGGFARAETPSADQQAIDTMKKGSSADQQKVSDKMAEIKVQEETVKKDQDQFGADSDQVRQDKEKLASLRKELADMNAGVQQKSAKKKSEAGEVPSDQQMGGTASDQSTSGSSSY